MPQRPIVLIHGYSDKGESFDAWREALAPHGYALTAIHTCEYETLTNEVSVKDIAEGFDRALRERMGLNAGEAFDAIVHSTGMLVIRAWLAAYEHRTSRLKHLIGLAPASFGSPLAHKGRSWLGSLFKGRKELGPDFLEAGDLVLDALELGSRFTWDLAHRDLIGEEAVESGTLVRTPTFGLDGSTPFVFTFCGDRGYPGLRGLINEDGTDGTVRWAGCALDTRKITVDLTVEPGREALGRRFEVQPWAPGPWSLIPVRGLNHATILQKPTPALVEMVVTALGVSDEADYLAWQQSEPVMAAVQRRGRMTPYQQFVVRCVDERGDPIPDYNIQLLGRSADEQRARPLRAFSLDVHVYKGDPSLRCFHVDVRDFLNTGMETLRLRVIASSGSRLVGYHGYGSDKVSADGTQTRDDGKWDAEIDITAMTSQSEVKFFYPLTTTLIEIRLNREPLPLSGVNDVLWFVDG